MNRNDFLTELAAAWGAYTFGYTKAEIHNTPQGDVDFVRLIVRPGADDEVCFDVSDHVG